MSINVTILLFAIASAESNGNPHLIGAHGERSAYQMLEITWNQHAKDYGVIPGDFVADSSNAEIAESRATTHMIWLCKELEKAGMPVTVESLASAWHIGAHAAIHAALHGEKPAHRGYVERVANLYRDALAKQPSKIPPHLANMFPQSQPRD